MPLLSIGNILVEPDVLQARFACNLQECRGACCIEGELGAPLLPEEALQLEDLPEAVLRLLPEKGLRYLRRHGAVELYQGVHYTRTVKSRECVFTLEREGITLCALEIAYRDGLLPFDKPISCRLFPIRVRKKFGLDYLVYEQHAMCRSAREAGREQGVRLVDYLTPALTARFGSAFVQELQHFLDSSSHNSHG